VRFFATFPGGEITAPGPLGGHVDLECREPELTPPLAEVVAAWPLGASLAAAVAIQGLRTGRRRTALNEALHELRRPLQALALVSPGTLPTESAAIRGSVQMATVALQRLEREINGDAEATVPVRGPLPVRPLLDSTVRRWQGRAALAGGSLSLRWQAGGATIEADRCAVAQALDNLVVNAIEHGGPGIVIEAQTGQGALRLAVVDSGREARPEARRKSPAELIARLSGRGRRGHGLRVVRRTVAAHGGRFRLRSSARGTEAIVDLPLSDRGQVGA
jgi:signal transduction histidine kinase